MLLIVVFSVPCDCTHSCFIPLCYFLAPVNISVANCIVLAFSQWPWLKSVDGSSSPLFHSYLPYGDHPHPNPQAFLCLSIPISAAFLVSLPFPRTPQRVNRNGLWDAVSSRGQMHHSGQSHCVVSFCMGGFHLASESQSGASCRFGCVACSGIRGDAKHHRSLHPFFSPSHKSGSPVSAVCIY